MFNKSQLQFLHSLADWMVETSVSPSGRTQVKIVGHVFSWLPTIILEVNDFNELCNSLDEIINDFDVDTETYNLLGSDGHGTNGAAFSMLSVHHEVDIFRAWLEDLAKGCRDLTLRTTMY